MAFLILGCASKPQIVTMYTHHPIYPKGIIKANTGVELFKDIRPDEEKKSTAGITNLPEELTVLITKDLRDAELFNGIKINYSPEEIDLVLTAEITSFYWKSSLSPTARLPYVQYIHDIGVTSGAGKGGVAITFIIRDAKTNTELARYSEEAAIQRKYSTQEAQSSGTETAQALREVVEKFILDILNDKERILQSLNKKSFSCPGTK